MMTITEALAEINLIKKKIAEKETHTMRMVAHPTHLKDPFQSDGGSVAVLERERQSLQDLRTRFVKIRSAISKANCEHSIEVCGMKKLIFDWLSWKREIYKGEIDYLRALMGVHLKVQNEERSKPQVFEDKDGKKVLVTYTYNFDISEIQKQIEKVEEIYGKLDGMLSLKNATIVIDV